MTKPSTAEHHESLTDAFFDLALDLLWVWRLELALLVIPTSIGVYAYVLLGRTAAVLIPVAVVLLAILTPPMRRYLVRILHRASVGRHLDVAFASLPGVLSDRSPVVDRVTRTPFGDQVWLGLRHGTSVEDLIKAESVIAASLGVREVRAVADSSRKNRVELSIVRRDPFGIDALPSPMVDVPRTNGWNPIPVGTDEHGRVVELSLPENNLLVGGLPNAGKSVALSGVVAGFALDPTVDLWLFDGKLVELAAWKSCARCFVGPDIEAAISVLEELRVEMDARYAELLAHQLRKVSPDLGLPLQVVVIDELALFVAGVDKKLAARFSELLRDLVARGRAAGVIVIAATQKPSIDIVPSALRDLFGFRWALRCATRDASDTVLGSGWASGGYSAADIDAANRGVGLLLHEGGIPVRLRSFHLTDGDVATIADRASRLRHGNTGENQQ